MDKNIMVMLSNDTYAKWFKYLHKYDVTKIETISDLLSKTHIKKPVLITETDMISCQELSIISKSTVTIIVGEEEENDNVCKEYSDVYIFLSSNMTQLTINKLIDRTIEYSCLIGGPEDSEISKASMCCALVDAIPDAIIIRNREGDYVDIIVNKDREQNMIFGNKEKMIGKNVKEVLNVRLAEEFIRKTREVLDTKQSIHYEYELMLHGEKRHVVSYIAPIKGTDNVVWIARDITDQFNDKIYIQSITDNRIGIINNLNHEVRTPLNYLSTTIDSITKLGCDSFGDKLGKMKNAVDQMKEVLGKLVDFNNILQDNIIVQNEEFDLYKLIESLSNKYIVKCYDKGVVFNTVIEDNIPRYYVGDKGIITKCLDILLDNAHKFTQEGEINILVNLSDDKLILSVKDTGVGIEKDKINDIFYEFIQEDLSPTKHYGGIGIGLSVLRGLIKKLNGKINLKSKKGIGTKFDISIPIEVIKKKQMLRSNSFFINKNALIVDDDTISRQILDISLKNIGFKVKSFTEGESVIDYLTKDYPEVDIVVVDWNIPKMDGLEIAKNIRNIKEYRDCKIVLVTSFYNNDLTSLCREAGIDSFIYKPIDNSLFNDILYNLFDVNDEEEKGNNKYNYKGANVLVLDDSSLNTEMIGNFLLRRGIEVYKYTDPIEAIRNIDKNKIDMAIIDIEMPVMDGFECSSRIRKINKALPIVMMSAKEEEIVARKINEGDLNGFLGKPVDMNLMEKYLLKILKEYKVENKDVSNTKKSEVFEINGIDVNRAMERFHWNKELFIQSVRNFLTDFSDEKEIMKKSLAEGEYDILKQVVHKIKGHSGNLSIDAIYNWCIKTENLIKREEFHLIDIDSNDSIIISISNELEKIDISKEVKEIEISDDQAKEIKKHMIDALKKRSVKDINKYLLELQNNIHPIFEDYDEIITSIKRYKYKDALEKIMERD